LAAKANAEAGKASVENAPELASVRAKPEEEVAIARAKGRPMLSWVGKRPLRAVTSFPAQHVESFAPSGMGEVPVAGKETWKNWPEKYPRGGLVFHGDNKEVLAHLLANGLRGQVQLIYIDPPFDSGADYVRKVSLRGPIGVAKLAGESYSLGEQVQYTDIWANDNYLQFMYERLLLLKEILAEDGSLFLHCDYRRSHHLRCLLDEVFGPENFVNEIVWVHQIMGGSHDKRFPKAHETIFWYAKSDSYRLRSDSGHVRVPFSDYVRNTMKTDEHGKFFYERRRMSRKATAQEAASKAHTRTYVEDPDAGTIATDVWEDMPSYQEPPDERDGLGLYPTQKTTRLLTRIIASASDPGRIVMDCFGGSGVAARVAQRLGRRWITSDINKGAVQMTGYRLQAVMTEQIAALQSGSPQRELLAQGEHKSAPPAQLAFSVYRVNDYDLAIQHNEAVNLACEHIGVTRTPADAFFEGTLGSKLVKLVPFGHALSPADLAEVKRELDARADESRDIVVVCLGKELGADAWLNEWNRMRKQGDTPNKIDIIELRSDPKYGKFFAHKPATARVDICRAEGKNGEQIIVDVRDFMSPSIAERLTEQANMLSPRITDWRSMVDSVMIDPTHDGKVFRIALSDVPERKQDYIRAHYELPAPAAKTNVMVKITDMLGEEVVVGKNV
jgi:DNA modification methylase